MEHFDYLLAAYTIIFVVIFLYVVFLRSRQRRLEAELRTLTAKLASARNDLAAHSPTPRQSA
jgi:CcmD family protein